MGCGDPIGEHGDLWGVGTPFGVIGTYGVWRPIGCGDPIWEHGDLRGGVTYGGPMGHEDPIWGHGGLWGVIGSRCWDMGTPFGDTGTRGTHRPRYWDMGTHGV